MSDRTEIAIDVVSDVVCPWCYVGKRRLEQAIAAVPELDIRLNWRPFQLDPTIPPEGLERTSYINAKLGGAARVAESHRNLEAIGAELGIAFAFGKIRRAPNTLDAHRIIRWAGEAEVQGEAVEALFRAFFVEGRDIGDRTVLASVAQEAGLSGAEMRDWLDTVADRDSVSEEIAQATRMGITGVPCMVIENRYAVMGAQEPQALARAFRDIAEEKRFGAKV